jgi:hypothetical protein
MLIQNVKVKVAQVVSLNGGVNDKAHWAGRTGMLVTLDIGENMVMRYEDGDNVAYCKTKKVDEILVRENWIGVEDGGYRYVLKRL